MATVQTLNQYTGTDKVGTATVIVAENMETACQVYNKQQSADPVIMQCTKQNISCVLPTSFTSFTGEAYDSTGAAAKVCKVTPAAYTVEAGTEVIFTADAGEGWKFSKWLIDGEDVEGDEGTKEVARLTIPVSASPIVVRAVFATSV